MNERPLSGRRQWTLNVVLWEMVLFAVRSAIGGFVPLRLISRPIIEAPNGHEQNV